MKAFSEGKKYIPVVKESEGERQCGGFASKAGDTNKDELDEDELRRSFKEITGEKADEFLEMAGKTVDMRNLKMRLHHTVNEVNKSRQSGQTPMTAESAVSVIFIYGLL